MKVIIKLGLIFAILAVFIGTSFPNLSPKYRGINFISLNAEEQKISNDVGASIVEAQTPKFNASKDLVPYDGKVPVLMYHVIGNEFYKKSNENILIKENFEAQMKWLHDNGYNTITPDQLYHFIKEKAPLPPKPIMLTFDDGNKDSYNTVFPILKNYNFTATMFIITKAIGNSRRVSKEDIQEMIDYGITIGSHTISHLDVSTLSREEMKKEIIDSKKILESTFGIPINYFCYPAGRYDDMVLEIVKEAKYLGAFTTHFGRVGYGDDTTTLVRVRINRSDSLKGFINKVEKAKTYGFTTPHHGDKRNKKPDDDGELGLDNNNLNKQKDKDTNKKPTDNKIPKDNSDTSNPSNDQTNNNNTPSDNQTGNNNTNPDPTTGDTETGNGSNNGGNVNGGTPPSTPNVGGQSQSLSRIFIKRLQ